MIKLGSRVRDAITGFEGVATKRIEALHGSSQLLVEGRDCGFRRDEWIEEGRLRETDEKPLVAVTELRAPAAVRPPP